MIGSLRTCVRKQPIIALYFESETVLKLYNLEARFSEGVTQLGLASGSEFKVNYCYWTQIFSGIVSLLG